VTYDKYLDILNYFRIQPYLSDAFANSSPHFTWSTPAFSVRMALPDRGFKFHLSATILNCHELACAVIPFLIENSIEFKCVSETKMLHDLNVGLLGITQVGKCFTVYPSTQEKRYLTELMLNLIQLTSGISGPRVPSDFGLLDSECVFYRYGVIAGTNEKEVLDLEKMFLDRDPRNPVPVGVVDLLEEFRKRDDNLKLPSNYVVIETLRQRGKGGVFVAIDLKKRSNLTLKNPKVIVKEARYLGEVDRFGNNAQKRLKNHHDCLKLLENTPYFPRFIDYFELEQSSYLVMEFVGSTNLNQALISGELNYEQKANILVQIIQAMLIAHQKNIVLVDLSPANIVLGIDTVYLVDLEDSIFPGSENRGFYGTPGFYLPRLEYSNYVSDEINVAIDYYALGAIAYSLFESIVERDQHFEYRFQDNGWHRPPLVDDCPDQIKKLIEHLMVKSENFDTSVSEKLVRDFISNTTKIRLPSPLG
jgi:Protein kinase domain